METKNTIINVGEIEILYREYCKEIGVKFSKSDFTKFLIFLEVDLFDWIKDNLKHFNNI